jgi:hypothetical protein
MPCTSRRRERSDQLSTIYAAIPSLTRGNLSVRNQGKKVKIKLRVAYRCCQNLDVRKPDEGRDEWWLTSTCALLSR